MTEETVVEFVCRDCGRRIVNAGPLQEINEGQCAACWCMPFWYFDPVARKLADPGGLCKRPLPIFEPTTIYQRGDDIRIEFKNGKLEGHAQYASPCSRSLLVLFDGALGRHTGAIPLVWCPDGEFHSFVTGEVIRLSAISARATGRTNSADQPNLHPGDGDRDRRKFEPPRAGAEPSLPAA